MKQLIEKDPDYFDPYLFLSEIFRAENSEEEAEKLLNEAYNRAIELITDKKGNWPDVLAWLWYENRHIISTIVNKAVFLWKAKKNDEALEIFRKNQEEGLVLNSSNAIDTEFICSCCGCCCGMLSAHQKVPDPSSFWINNFHAEIDSELCTGCQTCVDRCQTGAIRFRKKTNISTINEKKCIGCGNCVAVCPEEAIQLVKVEEEYIPPQTVEDLYDEIKSNR